MATCGVFISLVLRNNSTSVGMKHITVATGYNISEFNLATAILLGFLFCTKECFLGCIIFLKAFCHTFNQYNRLINKQKCVHLINQ